MCEQPDPTTPDPTTPGATNPGAAGEVTEQGLRLVCDGLALLTTVAPADRPGPQALDTARGVLGLLSRLQVLSLALVADVDTRRLHELDSFPSTGSWLQEQKSPLDRADVALARRYARLPAVAAAVADGRLSTRLAARVGQALDKVRPFLDRQNALIDGIDGDQVLLGVLVHGVADLISRARGGFDEHDPRLTALLTELLTIWQSPAPQLARVERAMVLLAERAEIEPDALSRALDELVGALLPLELTDAADRGHRSRGWRMQLKPDGSGYLLSRSEIDLELGELLATVITTMRPVDPDNPTDTLAWQTRRDAQTAADSRSQHANGTDGSGGTDGMDGADGADGTGADGRAGTGADGQAGTGADGQAGTGADGPFGLGLDPTSRRPRSQAQRDHDALTLGLRALLDSGALGTRGKHAPHLLITVPAEALNDQPGALPATGLTGTPLPAALVRRWLTDSRITRLVLSPGRRVLQISHTERTLKAHERLALHVQWGGRCAQAGCPSPPGTHLVPHHATPWATTGTTSYTDNVPFCDTTHHDVHDGQQTLRLRDGRTLGPHGWTDTDTDPKTHTNTDTDPKTHTNSDRDRDRDSGSGSGASDPPDDQDR